MILRKNGRIVFVYLMAQDSDKVVIYPKRTGPIRLRHMVIRIFISRKIGIEHREH